MIENINLNGLLVTTDNTSPGVHQEETGVSISERNVNIILLRIFKLDPLTLRFTSACELTNGICIERCYTRA